MLVPVITTATISVLKSLFMVLDFLYKDNCKLVTIQPVSKIHLTRLDVKMMNHPSASDEALKDVGCTVVLFCVSVGLMKTIGWLYSRAILGPTRLSLMSLMPRASLPGQGTDDARPSESRLRS